MKENLLYLVKEYFSAQDALRKLKEEYLTVLTSYNIGKNLKEEIEKEIARAQRDNDREEVMFWKSVLDGCFAKDKFPDNIAIKQAEEKIKRRKEEISYYIKKIKVIKYLLGVRETELLESFYEKMVLMGNVSGSSSLENVLEEEEKENSIRETQKKKITFDKM